MFAPRKRPYPIGCFSKPTDECTDKRFEKSPPAADSECKPQSNQFNSQSRV